MKQKLFTLLTLLCFAVSGAWATEASLKALANGTTSFKTGDTGYHQWTGAKTKNQVIYDKDDAENNRLMGWSNGNALAQNASGLAFGNSSKKSAFVFRVGSSSNISVAVAYNSSDVTVSLYYLGTTTDVLTDPNNMTPTGALSSVSLSSSTTTGTLTKSNGDAGYYMVFGTLRFIAASITVTSTVVKDYTVTAATNDEDMGTAAAEDATLDEGETTTITATPKTGYKFVNWSVAGTGSSLSSTTTNPTTLTMGTANTTVTANFAALETYTISYDKGSAEGATGSKDSETKYEDVAFTLPSSPVFTRDGYLQTGWSLTDGGTKDFELGGSYTTNAAQTFYPFWTAANTLTYNANGGSGSMAASKGIGSITLTACTFTKDGYSFVGWATSQANADAGIVAYADIASYSLTADATIYAVWAKNFTYLVPATSGDAPSSGDDIVLQSGSKGGSMEALSANLSYTVNGLQFGTNSSTKASVTLDYVMKAGSIIVLKLVSAGTGGRGLYLYTNAATPAKKATLGWTSATNGAEATFTYTVQAGDGLDGESTFQLWRNNTVQLKSLAVVNCETEAISTASGKTYATYVTTNALDFASVSDEIKAYVAASTASAGSITFTGKDEVPASTPLLIKTASAGATVNVPVAASTPAAVGTNYLVAGDGGNVTYDAGADHYYYILTNGEFKQANNSPVAVGKAYLALPSAATSNELTINFDDEEAGDVTGIATISSKKQNNGEYYNLNGQRVDASHKGIVIVNGKKFFNK